MQRTAYSLGIGVWVVAFLSTSVGWAVTPQGIVYESEDISSPKSAWLLNQRAADKWMLWTKEEDIEHKRSRKAVLASPTVPADRKSPEEGAPPLHSVVTDLKPGVYRVHVSNPGRPLAYSLDGRTWFKHEGSELSIGAREIPDGRFEIWVDDRYVFKGMRPGPGYFDYIRFVPVPASATNVEVHPPWHGLDRWLAERNRGFAVPATKTTDWVGFEPDGYYLKGGRVGHRFTYVFDRGGTFFPAVLMVDDEDGIEQLLITLNGKEVGCIIADAAGGRSLFSFRRPLKVSKGDKLTFTCQTDVGFYRVQTLFFATQQIVPPPPSIANVGGWSPAPGQVDVCWTTTSIVETGTLAYGPVGEKAKQIRSEYRGRNHRVQLRGLDPTKTYQARVTTAYRDRPVASKPIRFRARPIDPPPTGPQTIKLTVPEPTEHARRGWPATVGMPFAKGMLSRADDLRLFDAQGKPVPLQAETFSRWPDGSIKWAAVSFPADTVVPGTPAGYSLKAKPVWSDPGPSSAPVATVKETKAGWQVSAGTLTFKIDKKAPALFEGAGLAGDGGGRVTLVTGDGTALTCGPVDEDGLVVESNGPARALLRLSGRLVGPKRESDWRYLLRLTFWKQQPMVSVSVSVWCDQPSPSFREITSLGLYVPLGAGSPVRGAFEGRSLEPIPDDADGLWLRQYKDNHFRMRTAGKLIEGKRATGVAVAATDRARVTARIRDFWQTYPSGYAIKRDGLHVEFLPPLPAGLYSDPESKKWFHRLYAWFKDGKYLLRAGQLTQHEVFLRFDSPKGQADAARFAAWTSRPLLPQASPTYLCGTGVLSRPLFPRTKGVWDEFEAAFENGFSNHLKDREARRTFGWMHYGDWFGERILNYGNNEYDLNWGMGVQWMRTGDRRYFDRGLQMARHFTTVDTLHGDFAYPSRCLVWTHCYNHVGSNRTHAELGFTADSKDAQAYLERFGRMLRGAQDPQGHIYQPGNWLYAALTGDPWLRQVAERVCTHQAEKLTPSFNFGIERCGGWPLINATGAYAFSGDPYYLNAARIMIERCLERQDPATGGWLHRPPVGETDGIAVLGGKAFAVGILTHGILRYLDVEPRDRPDVRHMLVRGADWLMNESWNPGKGFRYISNSPKHRDTGGRGVTCLLNAEVIAFAYEQTRDKKYLDFWRDMMCGMLLGNQEGFGKHFAMAVRQTVYGLDRVVPLGIKSVPRATSSP